MASIVEEGGGRRLIQLSPGEHAERPKLRLGKCSQRDAETVRYHVENLLRGPVSGCPAATVAWVADLPASFRRRLERAGLVGSAQRPERQAVTAFVRSYIDGRADVKPNTRRNFEQAFKAVQTYLGEKLLDEVTPGDADDFRAKMKASGLGEGTIRRRCKRVRQFFNAAVKRRLIGENPFADVKCGNYADAGRFYFISDAEAQAVLDACPDAEWRLIFALCRYGGLRCPSELLALRWGDVDWERERFTVHASKTEAHDGGGIRQVPIFPELAPYLSECFDLAQPGAENVIARYRDANANLRTQLHRIIKRAGLEPWPKTFQNLRSTRETELAERFPIQVVTAWLGNSPEIARKHYLQVTEDHFRRALKSGAGSGASAVQNPVQQAHAGNRKASQSQQADSTNPMPEEALCGSVQNNAAPCDIHGAASIPPRGIEQGAGKQGNSQVSETGGAESGASGADFAPSGPAGAAGGHDAGGAPGGPDAPAPSHPDLAQVIAAWPTLPAALKAGILAMVKAACPAQGRQDGAQDQPTGGKASR